MQLSCTHENLATALTYLEWVVGRQNHLPILSNILFEAEAGRLRLSATNLEIGVIVTLGVKVEQEGKVALPAKLLTQFIQSSSTQEVLTLTQVGNQVVVENGRDEIRINSVESKDFPLIPEYTQTYPLELPVRVLSEALKKVLFAVSTNESRIELTGVLLTASDRGIHLVATDSFRLSEVTLPQVDSESYKTLQAFLQTKNGIILPVETLQELSRVIEHEAVSVHMALEDNQVFFEIGGVRIVSRVIQGKYPDYQQILPKEFQSTITLPRGELIRSLKMAASFAQYGSGEVQFVISAEKSTLEIVTTSSGVGEQRTTLTLTQPPSEDKTFIFQPRHLLEGMNAFSSETIILHLNTKDMPVLLTGDNPESQIYLVMPIRK